MKLLGLISVCTILFSTYAFSYLNAPYTQSLNLWKSQNLKDYSYITYVPSGELPIISTTTITVRDGVVVGREFTYDDQSEIEFNDETGEQTWFRRSWVEDTPAELGSHDEGFIPITLDALYAQCRQNILVQDPVRYFVRFETENNGLISRCTYYPQNEADGQDRGVFISSINY